MNDAEHIHRLAFSWWLGNILIGSFVLLISIGMLVGDARELFYGKVSIIEFVGTLLVFLLMFPVGFLLFASSFVTKIVVKPQGLECHTTTYILLANWKDLVNIGTVKNTHAGKSLIVVPTGGVLTLRRWAQPFQRFLRHNPKDVAILVSQFRASNGHSLETDILVNVSQRGELSAELESV